MGIIRVWVCSHSCLALALVYPLALLLVCLLGIVGAVDCGETAFSGVVVRDCERDPRHAPSGRLTEVVRSRCDGALRRSTLRRRRVPRLSSPPLSAIGLARKRRLG